MKGFRWFFALIFMVSTAKGYDTQYIARPIEATAWGSAIVGSDLMVIPEVFDTVENGGYIWSTWTKDDDGLWVNSTVSLNFDVFTAAPIVVGGYKLHAISGYKAVVVVYTLAGTDRHIVHVTWNPVTSAWEYPTYSATVGDTFDPDFVSESGDIVVENPNSATKTLVTWYWSGSAWLQAATITPDASQNIGGLFVTDDRIAYGLPGDTTVSGSFNGGRVESRLWTGSGWGAVEHTFTPPSRTSTTPMTKFGTSLWMTDDYAIISAPDSTDSNGGQTNAGALATFTKSVGVWTQESVYFPDKTLSNGQLGAIAFSGKYHALVQLKASAWYRVYTLDADDGSVRYDTVLSPTLEYNTASRGSSYDVISLGEDTAVLKAPLTGSYPEQFIITNLHVPVVESDDLQKIVSPDDVAALYFGRDVSIANGLAVTTSTGEPFGGGTTDGIVYALSQEVTTGVWSVVDSIGPGTAGAETGITFGSADLHTDGSTVVVSATGEDLDGTSNVGSIYVYDWDGTSLTFAAKLVPPVTETRTEMNNDGFGGAVKVDGDTIVVGVAGYEVSGTLSNAGAAFVYTKSGGTWDGGVKLPFPLSPYELTSSDAFGYSVAVEGDTIVVAARSWGSTGLLVVYGWDGSNWVISQYLTPTGFANMGFDTDLSGDFMVMSSSSGVVLVYERIGGTWGFLEQVLPDFTELYKATDFGQSLSINGNILAVGNAEDESVGFRTGAVHVFIHDGSTWNNAQQRRVRINDSDDSIIIGGKVSTDGSNIMFADSAFSIGANDNVGRVFVEALFKTCTVTTDCPTGLYCNTEDLCVEAISCTDHTDCIGQFKTGRLPYCDGASSLCSDKYTGTCTNLKACEVIASQGLIAESGVATATVSVVSTNMTKVRDATQEMITRTIATAATPSDLVIIVEGEESITFTPEDVALDVDFLNKVKAARCQGNVDLCTVTTTSRRMLESGHARDLQADNITVVITYTFDEAAYDDTVGFNFDDPDFLQALAYSIGVAVTEIDVTGDVTGTINIEVTLIAEGDGEDPLSEDLVAQVEALSASMDSIGDDLVAELGLDLADIETQTVDKCLDRDCNARGICDEATGICTCVGDWWGINCETACSCLNDGYCIGSLCICEYPFYGQRCGDESTCDSAC